MTQKALGTLDFCSRAGGPLARLEATPSPRCPGLAARLGRVAPCGACVVRVRREYLALSVRQDSVGYPAETDRFAGVQINTGEPARFCRVVNRILAD